MKRETKSKPVMVRMTPSEKKAAEAKARAKGLTLSAWLRMLAVTATMLAVATGCGPQSESDLDPSWPEVSQFYWVEGGVPVCDQARQYMPSDDGNRVTCTWNRVTVDGQPTCLAVVVFTRVDTDAPWDEPVTFVVDSTVCPDDHVNP